MKNLNRIGICLTLGLLFSTQLLLAQVCVSGNCITGVGTKVYSDSSQFSGQFVEGKKVKGIYTYKNGDVYVGEFNDNKRQGMATYIYKQPSLSPALYFEGEYHEDKKAFGTLYYKNGDVYTGQFHENKRSGFGTIHLASGKVWEGNWANDKPVVSYQINVASDSLQVDSIIYSEKEKSFKAVQPALYAVIVGVSDYAGIDCDLNYADDDALMYAKALKKVMPGEAAKGEMVFLIDADATGSRVLSEMRRVFSKATDQDIVLFYFSGHGAPGVLLAADKSYIYHSDIKQIFQNSKGKYRACIADACHTGSIQSPPNGAAQMHEMSNDRVAVIMSSRANEYSIESPEYRHGYFTYYLVKGMFGGADLDKSGIINMAELFIYTKHKVSKVSGGKQNPMVFGNNLDKFPVSVIK